MNTRRYFLKQASAVTFPVFVGASDVAPTMAPETPVHIPESTFRGYRDFLGGNSLVPGGILVVIQSYTVAGLLRKIHVSPPRRREYEVLVACTAIGDCDEGLVILEGGRRVFATNEVKLTDDSHPGFNSIEWMVETIRNGGVIEGLVTGMTFTYSAAEDLRRSKAIQSGDLK